MKAKEARRNQEEEIKSIFGPYALTCVNKLGFLQLLQGQKLQIEIGNLKLGAKVEAGSWLKRSDLC